MITFTIYDTNYFHDMDSIDRGGWKGIRFNSTSITNDTSKIKYCNIHYGKGKNFSSTYYNHNGGAIYIYNFSKVIIANCNISKNIAARSGGALYVESGSPLIINNLFTNFQFKIRFHVF